MNSTLLSPQGLVDHIHSYAQSLHDDNRPQDQAELAKTTLALFTLASELLKETYHPSNTMIHLSVFAFFFSLRPREAELIIKVLAYHHEVIDSMAYLYPAPTKEASQLSKALDDIAKLAEVVKDSVDNKLVSAPPVYIPYKFEHERPKN
jgi:hypothetical protein